MNVGRALIVMPTYNEHDNVPKIVPEILAASPEVDILIVDDSSPDGTGEVADALARRDSRVKVLHRPHKAATSGAAAPCTGASGGGS